jgi:hypothetical protein
LTTLFCDCHLARFVPITKRKNRKFIENLLQFSSNSLRSPNQNSCWTPQPSLRNSLTFRWRISKTFSCRNSTWSTHYWTPTDRNWLAVSSLKKVFFFLFYFLTI